jgi:hypothetical protein
VAIAVNAAQPRDSHLPLPRIGSPVSVGNERGPDHSYRRYPSRISPARRQTTITAAVAYVRDGNYNSISFMERGFTRTSQNYRPGDDRLPIRKLQAACLCHRQ